MRRWVRYTTLIIVLTGVTLLCYIRWNAWFGNPPEKEWTQDTIDFRFNTFANDSLEGFVCYDRCWYDTLSADTLRFILLGDVHNGVDSTLWHTIYDRHPNIDFYAQLGDFLERGYFYYYQQMAHELQGTPFAQLPIIATPGNHEYRKGLVRRLPPEWHRWFSNPQNGPHRFLGTTYYVDFASLRFIVIDTNGLQRLSDYTAVLTWLNKTIKEAGDRFTVVMMHHPVHSSAVGRQNVPIYLTFQHALKKADLVFSGHDHNYNRRLPFVGVNSAKKFYLSKVSGRDARICSGRQLYLVCDLWSDTLQVSTYLTDGTLYDRFGVMCAHDGKHEYVFGSDSLPKEIIDLPDKYQNRRSSHTIKRFLHRRSKRLATD
ncbi:MAG: metallophosphoesterase [Paludibacteraceae bacterium]|nr:metallophosphoesterase [Paludibacteraceae bacterium]